LKRKTFLQNTALTVAGMELGNTVLLAESKKSDVNKLPCYKGRF